MLNYQRELYAKIKIPTRGTLANRNGEGERQHAAF
jgi:hypothetical protein